MKLLTTIIFLWISTTLVHAQPELSQKTVTYFDSTRNRKLLTEIWWSPEEGHRLPLIMFSHGTGGNRLACEWFCAGLASRGFIVAAVDHFGNTYDNPIPIEFVSIWKRPQDISFVLSELLEEEDFSRAIDQSRIFAAGFSLGGYTSLALAGAEINGDELVEFFKSKEGKAEIEIPEMPGLLALLEKRHIVNALNSNVALKDNRIRGVFAMAPAAGQGFSAKSQFKHVDVPVFIVGVAADSVAPVKTNAKQYKKMLPDATLHMIEGKAGHYVFLNTGSDNLKKVAPLFFTDDESVDRGKIHADVVSLAERFFKEATNPNTQKKDKR